MTGPRDFLLTTMDMAILQVMRERGLALEAATRRLLDDRIARACVVFAEDIPDDVATVNSRVVYAVNEGPPERAALAQCALRDAALAAAPIDQPRGLALLGLCVGQTTDYVDSAGDLVRMRLIAVEYQPEAARKRRRIDDARRSCDTMV